MEPKKDVFSFIASILEITIGGIFLILGIICAAPEWVGDSIKAIGMAIFFGGVYAAADGSFKLIRLAGKKPVSCEKPAETETETETETESETGNEGKSESESTPAPKPAKKKSAKKAKPEAEPEPAPAESGLDFFKQEARRLLKMKEDGIIDDEEYAQMRKALVDKQVQDM